MYLTLSRSRTSSDSQCRLFQDDVFIKQNLILGLIAIYIGASSLMWDVRSV